MSDAIVVLCTCPDNTSARQLAQTLLSEKLAACVNLIPQVTSLYYWQGKMEENQEVQLVIKPGAPCSAYYKNGYWHYTHMRCRKFWPCRSCAVIRRICNGCGTNNTMIRHLQLCFLVVLFAVILPVKADDALLQQLIPSSKPQFCR